MRKLFLIAIMLFACSGWASTATLLPNTDEGTNNWLAQDSGTDPDCPETADFHCINNGVSTPVDTTSLFESSSDVGGTGQTTNHALMNSPGDYSTTNSATANVRVACTQGCTTDDADFAQIDVTTSSGTDTFTMAVNGSPDCTLSPVAFTISNCSFTLTTANWDTASEIDGATFTLTFTDNNTSMPDTMGYTVYEVEIVLDYNVPGAANPIGWYGSGGFFKPDLSGLPDWSGFVLKEE